MSANVKRSLRLYCILGHCGLGRPRAKSCILVQRGTLRLPPCLISFSPKVGQTKNSRNIGCPARSVYEILTECSNICCAILNEEDKLCMRGLQNATCGRSPVLRSSELACLVFSALRATAEPPKNFSATSRQPPHDIRNPADLQ